MSQVTNEKIIELLFIIAPQFITDDPIILAQYEALIEALECMINVNVLGCCALLAYANLLAHYLTLQKNPGLGVATSLTEGQLSIGISPTTSSGNYFNASPYGQAYMQIVGKYRLGAYVTNSRSFFNGPSCGCGH